MLNSGQNRVFDLSWLVSPGTVQSALLTGMFGLQTRPVVAEVIGWLIYAVPVMAFVLVPALGARKSKRPAKLEATESSSVA